MLSNQSLTEGWDFCFSHICI